jgi:lysophospholipase L1-like esterase
MNHWEGKLWYAYGTSMTSIKQGKFVPVVEKLSGLRVVNKGIPGGCLTPDGYGKGNVKRAVMTLEDGKGEADLITLEVLPNEGSIVGDIYDTDDASFCGCFNQCLRYLQEHTKAQIVVIIMIGGNDGTPETARRANSSVTPFEFAEIIERVARLNGVPVINVFCESGLGYARVKARDYQVDSIHLNDLGGKIVGNFVWSKLKDIPLWETE